MTIDKSTIVSIGTALGLLLNQFYGQSKEKADVKVVRSTEATDRHDVTYGMISYVDAQTEELYSEIAALRLQVADLKRSLKR